MKLQKELSKENLITSKQLFIKNNFSLNDFMLPIICDNVDFTNIWTVRKE